MSRMRTTSAPSSPSCPSLGKAAEEVDRRTYSYSSTPHGIRSPRINHQGFFSDIQCNGGSRSPFVQQSPVITVSQVAHNGRSSVLSPGTSCLQATYHLSDNSASNFHLPFATEQDHTVALDDSQHSGFSSVSPITMPTPGPFASTMLANATANPSSLTKEQVMEILNLEYGSGLNGSNAAYKSGTNAVMLNCLNLEYGSGKPIRRRRRRGSSTPGHRSCIGLTRQHSTTSSPHDYPVPGTESSRYRRHNSVAAIEPPSFDGLVGANSNNNQTGTRNTTGRRKQVSSYLHVEQPVSGDQRYLVTSTGIIPFPVNSYNDSPQQPSSSVLPNNQAFYPTTNESQVSIPAVPIQSSNFSRSASASFDAVGNNLSSPFCGIQQEISDFPMQMSCSSLPTVTLQDVPMESEKYASYEQSHHQLAGLNLDPLWSDTVKSGRENKPDTHLNYLNLISECATDQPLLITADTPSFTIDQPLPSSSEVDLPVVAQAAQDSRVNTPQNDTTVNFRPDGKNLTDLDALLSEIRLNDEILNHWNVADLLNIDIPDVTQRNKSPQEFNDLSYLNLLTDHVPLGENRFTKTPSFTCPSRNATDTADTNSSSTFPAKRSRKSLVQTSDNFGPCSLENWQSKDLSVFPSCCQDGSAQWQNPNGATTTGRVRDDANVSAAKLSPVPPNSVPEPTVLSEASQTGYLNFLPPVLSFSEPPVPSPTEQLGCESSNSSKLASNHSTTTPSNQPNVLVFVMDPSSSSKESSAVVNKVSASSTIQAYPQPAAETCSTAVCSSQAVTVDSSNSPLFNQSRFNSQWLSSPHITFQTINVKVSHKCECRKRKHENQFESSPCKASADKQQPEDWFSRPQLDLSFLSAVAQGNDSNLEKTVNSSEHIPGWSNISGSNTKLLPNQTIKTTPGHIPEVIINFKTASEAPALSRSTLGQTYFSVGKKPRPVPPNVRVIDRVRKKPWRRTPDARLRHTM